MYEWNSTIYLNISYSFLKVQFLYLKGQRVKVKFVITSNKTKKIIEVTLRETRFDCTIQS